MLHELHARWVTEWLGEPPPEETGATCDDGRADEFHRAAAERVSTCGSLDAIDVPVQFVPLLPEFDGRPTAEVREALRTQHGVELEPNFLRTLLDWSILVGVAPRASSTSPHA